MMNPEAERLMELYIRKVLREVRANSDTQGKIRAELTDHVLCYVEDEGGDPAKAVKKATAALGSPIAVGRRYNASFPVYMGAADWFGLIAPWLLAPAYLWALYENTRLDLPLWAVFALTALYAMICGTLLGKGFRKWPICVFSCLLPLAYMPGAFFLPTFGDWLMAAAKVLTWMAVFTLSCLWHYGQAAFPPSKLGRLRGLTAAGACLLLFGFMGYGVGSADLIYTLENNAASDIANRLELIAETEPEGYGLAMPVDTAFVLDYAAYQKGARGGQLVSVLEDLGLFVDDYDEFRGGDERDEYLASQTESLGRRHLRYWTDAWITEDSVDCATLADIDDETRRKIADKALKRYAEILSGFAYSDLKNIFHSVSGQDFTNLYKALEEAEGDFFDELRPYQQQKLFYAPKMDFVPADEVNLTMTLDEIKQKCLADIGFVITDGQNLTNEKLVEIFDLTDFDAPDDYFVTSYETELNRYIILWYDGQGYQMAYRDVTSKDAAALMGEAYDMIRLEADQLYEGVAATLQPASEPDAASIMYSAMLDLTDYSLSKYTDELDLVMGAGFSSEKDISTNGNWSIQKYRKEGWYDIGLSGSREECTELNGEIEAPIFSVPISLDTGYYRVLLDLTVVDKNGREDYTVWQDFTVGPISEFRADDLPAGVSDIVTPDSGITVESILTTYGPDADGFSYILKSAPGTSAFNTGVEAGFERFIDGVWRAIPDIGISWDDGAMTLEGGGSLAETYYFEGLCMPDLEPGTYRIVKPGRFAKGTEEYLTVQFEVTGDLTPTAEGFEGISATVSDFDEENGRVTIRITNGSQYDAAYEDAELVPAGDDGESGATGGGAPSDSTVVRRGLRAVPAGTSADVKVSLENTGLTWADVADGSCRVNLSFQISGLGAYDMTVPVPARQQVS